MINKMVPMASPFLNHVSSQRGTLDVVISPTAGAKDAKRAVPIRYQRNRKGALVDFLFYY
jgi:hypothetical protein